MDHLENLNIFSVYYEIKAIDKKIELLLTLRATTEGIKPNKLKEILVEGGFRENDALLNAIIKKDKYTESLQVLYKEKNAYEKYILDELDRIKTNEPDLAIKYYRDYKKMSWEEISRKTHFSLRQCHNLYRK